MNDVRSYSVVLAGDGFVDISHIRLSLLLRLVSDVIIGVDDVLPSDVISSQILHLVPLVALGNHDEGDQHHS